MTIALLEVDGAFLPLGVSRIFRISEQRGERAVAYEHDRTDAGLNAAANAGYGDTLAYELLLTSGKALVAFQIDVKAAQHVGFAQGFDPDRYAERNALTPIEAIAQRLHERLGDRLIRPARCVARRWRRQSQALIAGNGKPPVRELGELLKLMIFVPARFAEQARQGLGIEYLVRAVIPQLDSEITGQYRYEVVMHDGGQHRA